MSPYFNSETLQRFATWVQNSPNLLQGSEPVVETPPFNIQKLVDTQPYLGNTRLGFLYQELWQRLFQQNKQFEICESELQLIENKKTLGELDFIVNNRLSGEFEHWEIAIKFYLLKEGLWYGPNAIDRLDKKLTHMQEHQLKHGQRDYFTRTYPQYQNLKPKLMMQGRLYTNPFTKEAIPTHCNGFTITPSQINGFWCYHHQVDQIKQPLYLLAKPLWAIGLSQFEKPLEQFTNRPIHCQTNSGTFWFIVPNNWPEKHKF